MERWNRGTDQEAVSVQALRAGLCGHRIVRARESSDVPAPAEPSGSQWARVEGREAALSHHPPWPRRAAPRRFQSHTVATKSSHKRCCVIEQHTRRPAGPGPCSALTPSTSAPTPQSLHNEMQPCPKHPLRPEPGEQQRILTTPRSPPPPQPDSRSALAARSARGSRPHPRPQREPLPLLPHPPPCLEPAAALTAAREDGELRQEERGPAEPAQGAPPPPRRHLGAPAGAGAAARGRGGGGAGAAEGRRERAAPHGSGHGQSGEPAGKTLRTRMLQAEHFKCGARQRQYTQKNVCVRYRNKNRPPRPVLILSSGIESFPSTCSFNDFSLFF